MRKIDRETVQKILDTADIVEVVSDFVSLKRRGANYIGLCPFHNERTPSFSVSKSKGICKCFSCGKGGSPVNFLMELEQLSYNEALRYLAKKYNIEIKEHEMSDAEREEESLRESMLTINDFAMHHFEHNLTDTDDGRDIGLSYFRERGISDAMIKRFHLGYSMEKRDDLSQTALHKGFNEKFLLDTGLCYQNDRGVFVDRFHGRVIYPVFTVSGKVVAFGGRTLRKDKDVAKYVNSPESLIYRKSFELYGLYQAKQSIVRKDKCILVEGYMDVISMHQAGVENVVASSGTSLTEGQIRLIHRFTENVTVIYDSDPAGIKASLRGIDLLLAEGLNIKVLLLPEGDDPDSFAQSHSSGEVERYLADNERDFISFKTDILLRGTENDPVARSKVIQSIVRSISMIPDPITRTVYISQCSRALGIGEKVLTLEVARQTADRIERENAEALRRKNRIDAGLSPEPGEVIDVPSDEPQPDVADGAVAEGAQAPHAAFLEPYERELARYAVKYGGCKLCDVTVDDSDNTREMSVVEYIGQEFAMDDIAFVNSGYAQLFDRAAAIVMSGQFDYFIREQRADLERKRSLEFESGIDLIRNTTDDLAAIQRKEAELTEQLNSKYSAMMEDIREQVVAKELLSCDSDTIRRLATKLVTSKHKLSKIHTKFSHIATEREKLPDLVPMAVYNLKCAIVECCIADNKVRIQQAYAAENLGEAMKIMSQNQELNNLRKDLAKYLGERIISPRMK